MDEQNWMTGEAEARLRAHARQASAAWRVERRPVGAGAFPARVRAAEDALDRLYAKLNALPKPAPGAPAAPLLELRENPRLLRAALLETRSGRKQMVRLPRVHLSPQGEEPRVLTLAAAYWDASDSRWNSDAMRVYLDEVQRQDALELEELWALPTGLKFVLLEWVVSQASAQLEAGGAPPAAAAELMSLRMRALRETGHADWVTMVEPLIAFEATLREDPAGAYPQMDFDSREQYRKRVAELARRSECTETEVARQALALARASQQRQIADERRRRRCAHVGYYLIGEGLDALARKVAYRPRLIDRVRMALRRNAEDFYIGSIEVITVVVMAAALLPLVPNYSVFGELTVAFFLLLLPATQGVVDLLNNSVTSIFKAYALPKLDFSKGLPPEYATLVAVPTLLLGEKQVRELVRELELRFLANLDPHLHFALVTDLPDSVTRPLERDTDPVVDLAVRLIEEMNRKYGRRNAGKFLLLHRHRIFNARQGVWMGWERKRGKLLDLNKYLRGEFDAFPVKAGAIDVLRGVRYIITLDSDTQLPRGTAHAMVGAMAHPLNQAIIDPERRVVTEGYGILQPRVGVSVQSASRSRLASLYSGQTGFDIYTRAISDVYQDLFGEGIFTGKGIYEVETLHAVLDRRFPRNALLSHDLIEGSYARAGLVTDVEVIDDYPSHYSAYTRRQHRWVRGDWQIAPWLFSRVPDESGHRVRNPISTISRWKIFDNLRRSLVEPFTFILLVAGWLGLPGGALYWTAMTLFLMFLPTLVKLLFGLGRAALVEQEGVVREAFSGFLQGAFITLLNLVFLPHQTLLSIDAILRALVRRFITGQRLLEWETAAEAEASLAKKTPVDRYLAAMPLVALLIAVLIGWTHPLAFLVAAPILLLWGLSGGITAWLNQPPREVEDKLTREEESFLREHALRIWRYFHEYGGERHNYLIPDNVEEEGLFEAARVSPTNFGLLLNARQAAVQFGFLTVPEFVTLTERSFATMARLEMTHGHLYNWYDTRTLAPLLPATVSSVDSGNLAASLYTLHAGAASLLAQPVLSARQFDGIAVYLRLVRQQGHAPAVEPPSSSASVDTWAGWLHGPDANALLAAAEEVPGRPMHGAADHQRWWLVETAERVRALRSLLLEYLPWLLPEFSSLGEQTALGLQRATAVPRLEDAAAFAGQLDMRLARAWAGSMRGGETAVTALGEQLRSLLPGAIERLNALTARLRRVAEEAERLAFDMDFRFLTDKGRQLLSIGYDVAAGKLHAACYDMLSSEARIATFIAVAKGELPQQSWFKMGRTHTIAFGRPVLLSWTGTMFEYLMPSLWMRSYPDTLVSRTLEAVVQIQRAFARQAGFPWGISESGYAQVDDAGHYHYQAFGIPQIALKWDATAGPVVSPYSTFLALSIRRGEAMRNLKRMAEAGWIGSYGYYEAADYMEKKREPRLVREWMAHHQGMSLLALLNLLDGNIVQDWFHANPHLQAAELLLHEKPISEAAVRAEHKQFAPAG